MDVCDKKEIQLIVNKIKYKIEVYVNDTLAFILREKLGLTGTKTSCEVGECGACTVLLNNRAVNSCITLAVEVDGCEITTIEGLEVNGELDPIQEAFIEEGAIQCGYCTPGMIMATKGLLLENPLPNEKEIRHALAGNFCRCTGYNRIVSAVQKACNNKNKEENKKSKE